MKFYFSKYQGTGNDFVMLDNLNGNYNSITIQQIQQICDRRFGVGADGLIKINSSKKAAFEVEYFNSDGSKSFCGNGARCAVAFAETLGIDIYATTFDAIDGLHHAEKKEGVIALDMLDVASFERIGNDFNIHTGSPHYIRFVNDLSESDIVSFGREIRYSDKFVSEGINVNLVQEIASKQLIVYTYERGVEDETLSCGTGVTAAVLAYGIQNDLLNQNTVNVKVKGGELKVSFNQLKHGVFQNIQLIGPAHFVFKGELNV
ncbi:MAG: diaminopimelate epimerase [Flavobacteriia bacterium]|nr:diaminopimelate epimerase [Flavobacteriia bacterium]